MSTETLAYTDPSRVVATDTTTTPQHRSASGYGSAIPTRHRVRYVGPDGRARWHRVYVMVYGNGGTAYIRTGGTMAVLDTDTEHNLSGA